MKIEATCPDLKYARRPSGRQTATLDRLPPHAIECEQGALGCQLIAPNTCVGAVLEKFKADGAQAYYDLRHQTIQQALFDLFNAGLPIDLISVQQHLKDRQMLAQIGGIAYLSQLQDAVPSAANLDYYLNILHEKYLLRRIIQTSSTVVGRIYEFEGDVTELLDEVETSFMSVSHLRLAQSHLDTEVLVNQALAEVEAAFNSQGAITGIRTGFADIDRMTDGLHGGEVIIIAARPSQGKSSLAMNWAEHIALESQLPVGVFSLEMAATSLIKRSIGSVARLNIREPWLFTVEEIRRMTSVQARIKANKRNLIIDDTAGLSILELRARARRMVQQFGVKVLVVDYLQLLHGTSKKAKDNRQQEISEISSGLKALAKELNVPVIVLSQLNRDLEKNGREPRLSDLRESGSIEQDGDVIGLLYAELDEEGRPVKLPNGAIKSTFNLAKQRNGPTGKIDLHFFKTFTRFEGVSPIRDEDVPTHQKNH